MSKIIIDANKATVGRLASFTAKQILLGNEVDIVNCENAIILGNKRDTINRYQEKRRRQGGIFRGPKILSGPERMLKRTIRGMLPKTGRGRQLLKKVKCFIGVPENLKDEKMIVSGKVKSRKYIELKELSVGMKRW